MRTLSALLAVAALVTGCNLILHPESVPPPAPKDLVYTDASFSIGVAVQPVPPWTHGVPIDTFTSVPELPLGLSFDGDGGVAGTPLAISPPISYLVTATNRSGVVTGPVTLGVNAGVITGLRGLSAAGDHTCVVVSDAQLLCWGHNYWGQLGVGNNGSFPFPVLAVGVGPDIQGVASGAYHVCAITGGNAGAWCWGAYYDGVPDSGTWNSAPQEVAAAGTGLQSMAAGENHTCVVTGGRVGCWGANGEGQLGDGTQTWHSTPVTVPSLSGAEMVAAGSRHTCALTDGGVWCWGSNAVGQVGDSLDTGPHPQPFAVNRLPRSVQAIAAGGDHTCALFSDGGASCWGANGFGQLGIGTQSLVGPPSHVTTTSVLAAISAGTKHTCALTRGGGALCWGSNEHGQLGPNGGTGQSAPVGVPGLASNAQEIAAGGGHTCAVASGQVRCWGDNDAGQLGNGLTTPSAAPVPVYFGDP